MLGNLASHTSAYQGFKLFVGTYVPLERDVLHVVLGALIVGAALLAWRFRGMRHPMRWALGVSLVLGIAMEVLDRRDDIAWLGYWRWDESLSDVALTVAVPVVFLTAGVFLRRVRA